jgi:hypothetical protein
MHERDVTESGITAKSGQAEMYTSDISAFPTITGAGIAFLVLAVNAMFRTSRLDREVHNFKGF